MNTEDNDKRTPLDWAVLKGHKYIATLLLSNEATIGNALKLAKQKKNKEMEEILSLHEKKEKQLVEYDCRYLSRLINSGKKEKLYFLIEND